MDTALNVPTWAITGVLLALMYAAVEAGFFAGRRGANQSESARFVANSIKASIFGLAAFLMGFTFSMTLSRHEARRTIVVDEANALGTLYLRSKLVDEASGGKIRDAVRQYVDVRLAYFDNGLDAAARAEAEQTMSRLLDEIWSTVEASVATDAIAARTSQIVPAANDVIDLHGVRAAAVRNHLPWSVFALLTACILVSTLLVGHSSGQSSVRHYGMWAALIVLLALVMFVVVDFDRPRRGLVQIDHTPLVELRSSLPSP